METVYLALLPILRFGTAIFSLVLVFCWISYFIKSRRPKRLLAVLKTTYGEALKINLKENLIGRSKYSDIFLNLRGIEKRHALLYMEKGDWKIAPLEGKVLINMFNVTKPAPLSYGDKVTVGNQVLTFQRVIGEEEKRSFIGGAACLIFLSAFQLTAFIELALRFADNLSPLIPLGFFALILGEWMYYIAGSLKNGFKMILEIPVLYLTTLGLAICSTTGTDVLLKHIVCYIVGFIGYLAFTALLKRQELILKLQRVAEVLSLALLYYTAFAGTVVNSSRNWLSIGSVSFQPSELCKVAFVLVAGVGLYTVYKKPARIWEFLIYSVLSMGALAIMRDFGAVLIYFAGLLMVLSMRQVNTLIIASIGGAALMGGIGVIALYPYVARRFGVWLHAWENVNTTGYQQTRTMIYSSSGGLLGVGGGNGHLTDVSAAETDLVFGVVSEEWGGIVALCCGLCFVAIGLYAFRLIKNSETLFNSILVGTAAVMLIFQAALNIFGSLDLLPLTGVTMIFVSRGGTSLISALFMMSFFKAAEGQRHYITPVRDEESYEEGEE